MLNLFYKYLVKFSILLITVPSTTIILTFSFLTAKAQVKKSDSSDLMHKDHIQIILFCAYLKIRAQLFVSATEYNVLIY